jgi:hypothetical protein
MMGQQTPEMPAADPQGQVALMLCESLLHVLVEQGILTREKAVEAIATVDELMRESGGFRGRRDRTTSPIELIERIAATFAAKD